MAENLNTLYYALGLDDHEMQEGLKKAIQNLSVLDDEFNRINKAIEETFGKKIKNAPIHNEIKGLKGELQALEKQWNALTLAERRGQKGEAIRAEYEKLRKEAGNLNNSLARLYSESQKTASGQKGLAAQFGLVNKELTLQSRLMSNVNTLFTTYISIFAVKSFIQSLARVRGEFENQQIALRAILRDAEAADRIFGQIKSFAVVSPFEFKDLVGYAKQLSAFQVPVDELFETTKRLADVSAGLGVGMDRIILAYGQVRSAAVLRGQELRQFTEAGIPLVDELAKKFSELEGRVVSAGDVFEKISNRMVSFEMVKEIFEDMTNEGGMFYMMQEKQAESLKGKIANLADAYDIMLNDIGEANDGILKGGVEGLSKLMNNWRGVADALKVVVVTYGTYRAAVIALNISDQIAKYSSLTKAIQSTTAAQKLLNSTLLTNPWVLAATAIAAVGVAMYNTYQEANRLRNELESIANEQLNKIDSSVSKFEELSSALYNSVEGSQQYRDIISQINRQYGEYLPNLLNEANALTELKKNYDLVTDAIYNKAKAQAYEKGQAKIEEEFGEIQQEYTTQLIQNLTGSGISEKAAKNLVALYRAELEKQVGEYNPIEIFNNVYQSYFQTAEKYFTNIGVLAEQFREGTPFFRSESWGWESAYSSLVKYNDVFDKVKASAKEYSDYVDTMFSRTGYNTEDEAKKIEEISKKYEQLRDEAYKSTSSQDEYNEALDRLNIEKLKETLAYYKGIAETTPELARPDIIKQLENQLNLLTKTGEAWRDIVKDTIGKNKLGFVFNVQTDDDIFSYIDKLRNEYAKLKGQQKEINDGLVASDDAKNTINSRIKILESLSKALNFSLEKDKRGGSTKDPNAERLKEQIDLIKKAQAQYEKYLQIMSPDEALNAIRTDQQFMALDVQFEPDKVRERLQMVMNDIGKLPQSPELEKLKKSIQVAFTDIDYTEAKNNFDQFLSDLTKELDTYKDKYNFYEQLLGITGDQNLAVNLAFNGDFEKASKGIIEQIQQGMIESASGTGLTLDQIMNLDFTKSAQDLGISEKLKEFLQKSVDEIGKINFAEALDAAKLVAEYQSIQDKINTIIRNGAKEQEDIERNRAMLGDEFADQAIAASKKKTRQQVAALESESFKLTTFYQQLFGDISSYGNKSLDFLINKTESILNQLQTDDAKTQLKEKGVIDIEVDNQKLQLTESDVAKLTKRLGELNKEATGRNPFKELSTGISDYKKATDEVTKAQEKYDNATTEAEKSTAKLALEKAKFEQNNSFAKMFNSAAEAAGELSNAIGGVSDILGTLGVDMDGAGGAIVGGLQQTLSSLGSIDVTKPFSIITGAIGAVGGIFKSIFGSKDAKLDKKIKASEKEVRRLQNAYSDLERTIDKSLGTDKYNYTSDQIKNIQAQQAEVALQAQAERDKKKTDQDKVADLERQYVELGQQIEDILDNIRDEVIGSTADEIAQELGNAFFDAFAAGEDYAEAWGSKVKDIVGDIVKRMLIDKLLDKQIGAAIDKYSAQWMDNTGNINTDKVISSSKDFYNELIGIGDGFQAAIEALTKDPFFMQLLGPGEEAGEGLSKGIKGITEDTAQLLASYLNAIRGSVLLQELYMKNIDTNVAGIYQAMGGSPNITTTTTIPPEIIAAISEPFKLNNTLLASIDANMANVHSISANALAQLVLIQANTYNTVMEVKRCADYLESVITPGHPKGRSGVNVWA